jgi:hypothetical protein
MGVGLGSPISFSLDQGALIIRPLLQPKTSPVPQGLPPTRQRLELLRALDAHGMLKQHFQRLSHDDMSLGEFAGLVSRGREVNAVTLERLKSCLERRQTCKETWDATLAAVLAVRVGDEQSSSDRSDIDTA